jgi:hypothetical protein
MSGKPKKFVWRASKLEEIARTAGALIDVEKMREILDAAEPCIQRRIRKAVWDERIRVLASIYEEQESRI